MTGSSKLEKSAEHAQTLCKGLLLPIHRATQALENLSLAALASRSAISFSFCRQEQYCSISSETRKSPPNNLNVLIIPTTMATPFVGCTISKSNRNDHCFSKTKKAFSVAILQRRLVCPDGIRQRRTPQGSAVFSIFRSSRMITSLSEERMGVFYQLPNGPARTNWQWTRHTSHDTQYTDAPISNVAGFYIFTEIPGTVPARH